MKNPNIKHFSNKELLKKLEYIDNKLDDEFFKIYNRDRLSKVNNVAFALFAVSAFSVSAFYATKILSFFYWAFLILFLGFFVQIGMRIKIHRDKKKFKNKRKSKDDLRSFKVKKY